MLYSHGSCSSSPVLKCTKYLLILGLKLITSPRNTSLTPSLLTEESLTCLSISNAAFCGLEKSSVPSCSSNIVHLLFSPFTRAHTNTENTCTISHRKHIHNNTQDTHAQHHTGNTCTTSHRNSKLHHTGISKLHYTGNTCTTLHKKYMHYITQKTHA